MKFLIWNEKCELLVRIKCLEEDGFAKQVYKQAEENGWPGLGKEVKHICEQIQIPDINKYNVQYRVLPNFTLFYQIYLIHEMFT